MTKRLRVNGVLGRINGLPASQVGKELGRVLSGILDQFADADNCEDLMMEALQPTFDKSQQYVPKKTLRLMHSGYLEKTGFRGKPRVEIGYGRGGSPHYTAYVHEMTDIPHVPPTRSKFLQAAVMEDLEEIYARLGAGYSAFMHGGG